MKFLMSFLITLILSVNISFSNTDSLKIDSSKLSIVADTVTTLNLESIPSLPWYEHKATPWIVSIFVAVLSVIANLIISYYARRTSVSTVKTQIENSVRIASHQFQATLNSKNRQDWINDVRTCISEFVTHCRLLNILIQEQGYSQDKANNLHEKISLFRSKLLLLLTPDIEQHKLFLEKMNDLLDVLEIHLLNTKAGINNQYNNQDFLVKSNIALEAGRSLLYFEWNKIQNISFEK